MKNKMYTIKLKAKPAYMLKFDSIFGVDGTEIRSYSNLWACLNYVSKRVQHLTREDRDRIKTFLIKKDMYSLYPKEKFAITKFLLYYG